MSSGSETIDYRDLEYEDLEGIEGAKFARLKFGPCDARVIKYPANTKIPLHKHSGETLKIVLSGKIAFEDGEIGPGLLYKCDGSYGYYATVPVETFLLLLQAEGTTTIRL